MIINFVAHFARQYNTHLKHLKLKGLQPKTINAYARAIRRLGGYFDYQRDIAPYVGNSYIRQRDINLS